MKQIDIGLEKNKEYLDKIDFIPYIKKSYYRISTRRL